jgi:hypothetical protein
MHSANVHTAVAPCARHQRQHSGAIEMEVANFVVLAEPREHFVEAIVTEGQEPLDVGARQAVQGVESRGGRGVEDQREIVTVGAGHSRHITQT